jgi:hypothetical protein
MSKAITPWKLILSAIVSFGILVIFKHYFVLFSKLNGFNVHGIIENFIFVVISAAFVGALVGISFAFLVGRLIIPRERSWFLWSYGIMTTSLYILWVLSNYFTNSLTTIVIIDSLIKFPIEPFFAYLFLTDSFMNVLVRGRT